MKTCKCGNKIPTRITVDGTKRNLQNRTQCLTCLPFGQSRYRKKTIGEKRSAWAAKAKRTYDRRKERNGGVCPILLYRNSRKKRVVDAIGGKCQICGYDKAIRNLVFHHLCDKEFPISSRSFQYSWDKLIPEIKKCALLCHNCHGEVHDNLVDEGVVEACNYHTRSVFNNWTRSKMVNAANS